MTLTIKLKIHNSSKVIIDINNFVFENQKLQVVSKI